MGGRGKAPPAGGRRGFQRGSSPLAGSQGSALSGSRAEPRVTPSRARTRIERRRKIAVCSTPETSDQDRARAFPSFKALDVSPGRRSRNRRNRAVKTQNPSHYHNGEGFVPIPLSRPCGLLQSARRPLRSAKRVGPVPVDLEKIPSCSPAPLRVAGTLGKSAICSR